jgi:glutathione-regulated potassium-efflux system ancillary protein KefC
MARRWVELRKRGVELIQRETSESALRTGRTALERLGVAPYEARERADRYRRHKIAALDEMLPYFGDETRRLSAAKAGREQLERQFAEERAALDRSIGAWSFEAEMADDRLPAGASPDDAPEPPAG